MSSTVEEDILSWNQIVQKEGGGGMGEGERESGKRKMVVERNKVVASLPVASGDAVRSRFI